MFDIEIDQRDPEKLVDIIAALEPTFGAINLEDIKGPECFEIEAQLKAIRDRMAGMPSDDARTLEQERPPHY